MKKKLLKNISPFSTNIKIAITGLSRAGKTVFITSLIDQLLYQDKIVSVTSSHNPFKVTIKPPLANAKRFDYYSFIDLLKNKHTWTKGTDEITHTILEVETKSRFAIIGNSTFKIELIDYPGEWLLDLTLLKIKYKEWSNQTITWLKSINDEKVKQYLQTLYSLNSKISGDEVELKIHNEYKELLIYLKKQHYSLLTPGRFIIPSDLANDPILHFAPLTSNASKSLFKIFEKRYNRYVNDVVKEIQLKHFKGFQRQVVLVDIVEALQNGYDCYIDMKIGLKRMLYLYKHKNKNFFAQWLSPSIKKVLFVATKADQVTASQHHNFSELLLDMTDELRKDMNISHIDTDTQIVASLKSTINIAKKYNGKVLSFVRGILEDDNKTHDIYAGKMPSKFPAKDKYDISNYGYKNFLPPQKSYRENEALEHINMDKIIHKLLGDLL